MHFSRAQTPGDRPTHAGAPGAGACRWIWQMQSLTADVVVIGSGMGGGHHRARAGTPGFDVLVLEHEPYIAALAEPLRQQGVNRSANAMGVDRRNGGASAVAPRRLSRQAWCTSDAETCAIDPDRATGHARLLRGVRVDAIVINSTVQRVHHLVTESRKGPIAVRGATFALAAGAVNSAAPTHIGQRHHARGPSPSVTGARRGRVGHGHIGSRPAK